LEFGEVKTFEIDVPEESNLCTEKSVKHDHCFLRFTSFTCWYWWKKKLQARHWKDSCKLCRLIQFLRGYASLLFYCVKKNRLKQACVCLLGVWCGFVLMFASTKIRDTCTIIRSQFGLHSPFNFINSQREAGELYAFHCRSSISIRLYFKLGAKQ